MLIQDWFLSAQQLRWLLTYHNWIRCYSCHMLSENLPYDLNGMEVIGIAFIRNPVDRFVSSYNFQKADNYKGGFAQNTNFDDFLVKTLVDVVNPMWRNGQTFVLGGSGSETGLARISERLGQERIILLPIERYDESCILLERLFPDDFKDCSYIRYNVSKRAESISKHQRNAVSQYMDIDFKLLTSANDYLDSTMNRLFPDLNERQKYIDDFRYRCHLKKRRKHTIHRIKNICYAVKAGLIKRINFT